MGDLSHFPVIEAAKIANAHDFIMIRFHDACGTTGKTVAARLLPDTDLIEGIEEVCKKMILNMLTLPVWEVSKNVVI